MEPPDQNNVLKNPTKAKDKPSLDEINKKIIEVKKKIQLSEGQRKAAFEEYEAERKTNADLILKLKKEIKEMTIQLQIHRDAIAADKVKNIRLESVVGPLKQRTCKQLIETLDLQTIDLKKQLDLIKHRKRKKHAYITKLAKEYQILLFEAQNKEIENKIENPISKKMISLQNNIHRVEMQWREACHVRKSYRNIRSTLLQEAARFESRIKESEEQLEIQEKEIQELQKLNEVAAKTRSQARSTLEKEERTAINSGKIRERQEQEYKKMVSERRLELEKLERRIFQSGKSPARPDTADDISQTDQEESTPTEDQEQILKNAFEKLKEATGATSTEEVLYKFQNQRDTQKRLDYLRRTTELEKRQLEQKQSQMIAEIEKYKYTEEIDKDKNNEKIQECKEKIQEQIELTKKAKEEHEELKRIMKMIIEYLSNIYIRLREFGIKPQSLPRDTENGEKLVNLLQTEMTKIVDYFEEREKEKAELVVEETEVEEGEVEEPIEYSDEMLLPPTYNIILRRTPVLPEQVGMPAPVGKLVSEDEEEVPSRGLLKRQAQLVIDAKLRRKNVRIPALRK